MYEVSLDKIGRSETLFLREGISWVMLVQRKVKESLGHKREIKDCLGKLSRAWAHPHVFFCFLHKTLEYPCHVMTCLAGLGPNCMSIPLLVIDFKTEFLRDCPGYLRLVSGHVSVPYIALTT